MTPRLGQPDFPLAGLQLLYGGDNVVTKLEVGDKAFIIESNRIVREVIVLKRSRDFFTVRFVENTSGGIQLRASRLAKALAESLFDDESNIVRLDMSEYMEKYSVSRLIGAPPGYVGYDEGGQLTEAVRRKPYSVVLFDEVEKAHPDVFNVLLQVLDDGRITDSQGRTVDFKNTIIIMTSNIGSSYLLEGINPDGSIKPEAEEAVMGDLKNHFRPEFLNRLDEIIMFKPLTKDNISNIINLLVADVNKRLADKELEIVLTDAAKDFIVENGFDPMYGARPLKRYVQKTVETLAAKLILAGNINTGDDIVIDLVDGKLTARAAARQE